MNIEDWSSENGSAYFCFMLQPVSLVMILRLPDFDRGNYRLIG